MRKVFKIASFIYYGEVIEHDDFIEVHDCKFFGENVEVGSNFDLIEPIDTFPKIYFFKEFLQEFLNRKSTRDIIKEIV